MKPPNEKLKKWAKVKGLECSAICDSEQAHFWLTAFVKLVRERATDDYRNYSTGVALEIGLAYNEIVQELGLE